MLYFCFSPVRKGRGEGETEKEYGEMKNLGLYNEELSVPRKEDLNDKQSRIDTNGILKGNGAGNISAAVPGTDYIASGNIIRQRLVSEETTPSVNYEINWLFG